MRFSIDLELIADSPFVISSNYSANITSLIKKIVRQENEELFSQLWDKKRKNSSDFFTFSCYIPESSIIEKRSKNTLKLNKLIIKIIISSTNTRLLNRLKNTLQKLNNYSLFGYPIKLRNTSTYNYRILTDDPIKFNTLSPIIIKKSNRYLFFDELGFEIALIEEIKNMYCQLIDKKYNPKKNDIIVTFLNARKIYIQYNKNKIKATIGTIKIYASKKIQQIVYDAGIGILRSNGFGMLEITEKERLRRK